MHLIINVRKTFVTETNKASINYVAPKLGFHDAVDPYPRP